MGARLTSGRVDTGLRRVRGEERTISYPSSVPPDGVLVDLCCVAQEGGARQEKHTGSGKSCGWGQLKQNNERTAAYVSASFMVEYVSRLAVGWIMIKEWPA
jgi:hypothetical protein